ncbi:MAG: murein biosynthesis integral membrane protein MurJ [Candidatus Binatia bacterium]
MRAIVREVRVTELGQEGTSEKRPATRLGAAALLLAASVLLSRVLGYAREALLAYQVGARASTDAYFAAFQIPDLLNYLLAGGALSVAFLPLYTRHLSRGDFEAADRFLATVLGTLGAVAVLATAALWWWAEPLVALQFPHFDPPTQALTVHLTRIVLPAQIFFITGGIVNATLLARERFGAAAAAPLIYNAGIIAGGLLLAPHQGIGVEGFAWGALVGAVLGPFLAPLLDASRRVRLYVRVSISDRAFLSYLVVAAPLMFGQTLLTVDEWYGRWFGALLDAGTVAHLAYARRLMQVPVAVVGQAIAAAALPTLARLWAEERQDEFRRLMLRTLQAGLALAVCGGAAVIVLARPMVELVYQHGAFTVGDTAQVASILALFCLAVPAWIAQQIAVRAFYARGDTWHPMLLGTAIAIAAIPLYLWLAKRFGVLGIAAAGTIGMSANALATLSLARWLHGGPKLLRLLDTAARAALIATIASIVTHLSLHLIPRGISGALVELGGGGLVFGGVVLGGVVAIGDEPMRSALHRMFHRRWKAEQATRSASP